MGTESLIPIMIIDDKSRYSTHENNKKDQIAAANEMGECLKNAMTDCYLNNTVTKEAYISKIQNYFSQATHRLTFEPNMEVTLVDQYGRSWNEQRSVPLTSKTAVSTTTSANHIATPSGFVASINDFGQGKVVYIAFQEVEGALGYKLYVDGIYVRNMSNGVNIPVAEFSAGSHTFAVTAFNDTSESNKTPASSLSIEPVVEPTAPAPTTPAVMTPTPTTNPTVEETLPAPEGYSPNGQEMVDALTIGGNFYLGMWDVLKIMGEGIYNTVRHPIKTVKAIGSTIGYTVAHPIVTGKSIWQSVSSSINRNVIHGNANTRSRFIGRIVVELALAKGVDKVVKGIKGIKGIKGASGAGLNKKLMNELAESGVKYNADDVVMITKNSDGKLLWLENGNSSAGLKHIVDEHVANFADKGITDIPSFLNKTLQSTPIKTGTSDSGPFADYLVNGSTYRVAYGSNGFIVSFYPIK